MGNIRTNPIFRLVRLPTSGSGFTLIELLVVLGIMSLMLGMILIDFGGRRSERDLNIAQNELVTNIRKVQSNSLFSRNVNNLKPGQYYILKFSLAQPDRYFLQAISDVGSGAPILNDMETVRLPGRVNITSLSLTGPIWSSPANSNCTLVAFKSPFARTYLNNGCTQSSPAFMASDDYQKLIDHKSNINGATVSTDADLQLTFSIQGSSVTKKVLIKGITGLVCPTVNGTTCSF